MSELGIIYQSNNFEVTALNGEKIEDLLGLVMDNDLDNHPMVINLKVTNKTWQRYFLDAWIGFWEDWGELTDEGDDNDRFVDYGKMFELIGKTIKSIKCLTIEYFNCQIILEIEDGSQFILRLIDPIKNDTESEVVFLKSSAVID